MSFSNNLRFSISSFNNLRYNALTSGSADLYTCAKSAHSGNLPLRAAFITSVFCSLVRFATQSFKGLFFSKDFTSRHIDNTSSGVTSGVVFWPSLAIFSAKRLIFALSFAVSGPGPPGYSSRIVFMYFLSDAILPRILPLVIILLGNQSTTWPIS